MFQNRLTPKIEAAREWSAWLICIIAGVLLYESLTGITILLLPFSVFNQFAVLLHTVFGFLSIVPAGFYSYTHWWMRIQG